MLLSFFPFTSCKGVSINCGREGTNKSVGGSLNSTTLLFQGIWQSVVQKIMLVYNTDIILCFLMGGSRNLIPAKWEGGREKNAGQFLSAFVHDPFQ